MNQVLINDPDFANIVGVYNRAESAKTSMQQAYWGGNSTYGGIQDDIIAQENDPKDIQLELTQAKSAIEQLLANDKADLAPVVRDELTAQKAALTKALDLIKQGKFDAAAANDPDMQKLTNVLQAIDSNDSNPPLPMDTVIQRQATLDALKSVTDDKSNMEKLEGALKDNPNYAHIFEKAPDGSYAFPDKLRDLISSKELEPKLSPYY